MTRQPHGGGAVSLLSNFCSGFRFLSALSARSYILNLCSLIPFSKLFSILFCSFLLRDFTKLAAQLTAQLAAQLAAQPVAQQAAQPAAQLAAADRALPFLRSGT